MEKGRCALYSPADNVCIGGVFHPTLWEGLLRASRALTVQAKVSGGWDPVGGGKGGECQ